MATTKLTRWAALALLLLGVFLAGRAWSDTGWRIVIKGSACVTGPRITLGQIAEVQGEAPPGAWEKLSASELWEAPNIPGRQVQVVRKQLEKLFKYYLPEDVEACVFPTRLTYQLGGRVYTQQELTRLIVDFLTPRARNLGGDIEIKDIRVPEHIFLARDYDQLQMALADDLAPGRVGIKFRVTTSDGKIVGRYAGSAFLNVWAAVACAAEPLSKLESVTPDKVTFMRKNLAYVGRVWDGKSGPYRVNRTLGTGMPLLEEYLEPMPMVVKGDKVNLVYTGSTIQLAVKAEAMNDADQGELVEVRNLQSNKTVLATVVDRSTVVVR